ncbi:MAG: branched-chain amino acid ABC transporter permease [Thermodesulfobacteriota bacterium]|nr:branched-chain amino acid ABC transporter permease [Thermodesulfobacteriota bacterium]
MWRPCGTFDDTYKKDIAIIRTPSQWSLTLAAIVALFFLPYFVSGRVVTSVNLIALSIISAQGLNILTGLTGQISLGQGAFMGVGAYTMMMLMNHAGFPLLLAIPCAMLASGLIGLVFGLPSLRIKGFYLAMATLAAQFIIPWMIVNIRPDLTGGTSSVQITTPTVFGIALVTQQKIYYVIMFFTVVIIYLTRNLARSKIGRAFVAIRDNDLAAEIMGVEIYRYKLLSFFICSLYAGLAGCMWALWVGAISVDFFTLHESIWYLGMIIVGGLGSIPGAVFGVIFIRVLELVVQFIGPAAASVFPDYIGGAIKNGASPFIFGLAILIFLIYEPLGLAHRWEIVKHFYRRWPFSY